MTKTGNQIAKWKAQTKDPRSVKQIREDLKAKRSFIKDTLWAHLLQACKTRFDLKDALNVTVAMLDQANQQEMLSRNQAQSKAPVETLPLLPAHMNEEYLRERRILELFTGMSLSETRALLEGLVGEIQLWTKEEDKELGIGTLKATFLE